MSRKIIIEKDITRFTLIKIIKNSWFNFDDTCESKQPLEDLDNGFIEEDTLKAILKTAFREKTDGSFPNSTKTMFGSRNKCRYVKSCLENLLNN